MFLEDQTYAVIGAAIEVLNELGHGIHEKPYENALVVELGLRESLRTTNSFQRGLQDSQGW
jgi:GxxExxY protein